MTRSIHRFAQEGAPASLRAALAVVLACGLVGAAAPSRDDSALALPLESAVLMHVDGDITIEADGRVADVAFTTKFDDALRTALAAKIRAWRFKPVLIAGQARRAQTPFRVMLAATQVDGHYRVRIDDTRFGAEQNAENLAKGLLPDGLAPPILAKRMVAPQYPSNQMRGGKIGSVHLVIRVAPDGHVADVVATQSLAFDIGGKESEASARRSVRAFESNAIAAARQWTFIVPPGGATRSASDMTVATDVEYVLRYDTSVAGQWVPVKRAPKRPVAWLPEEQAGGTGIGMAAAGGVAGVASPYQLAAPVSGDVVM